MVDYDRFIWIYGRPNPFWIINRQLIQEIIQEYGLEPVPAEHWQGLAAPLEGSKVSATQLRIDPKDFCGGMRIAHLHYAGELYELNPEQWAEFSNKIISNFQMKLDQTQAVTVESLLEVSDAINGLPQGLLQKK